MIILVGASASGKTEVAKALINKYDFSKVVTYTTREKRVGEKNKIDYYFVTKEKFQSLKEKDFFIETTEYNKNFYGTPKNELALNKVLIVDPKGLKAIRKLNDKTIISFYILGSEENRIARMKLRGDSEEHIQERIINDRKDFSFKNIGKTDFVIEGDDVTVLEMADEIYNKYIKQIKLDGN